MSVKSNEKKKNSNKVASDTSECNTIRKAAVCNLGNVVLLKWLINNLKGFYEALREFIGIYSWLETWIIISVGFVITGFWVYLCFALSLPDPIRAIMIWGMLGVLWLLVAYYNPKGVRK